MSVPAAGQPRPLATESEDGVGSGNVAVTTGVDFARDARYTLSSLDGDLWRLALIRIDVGLSAIADVEISGGLRDYLTIRSRQPAVLSNVLALTDPSATSAFDDIIIGTRIRVLAERPGRLGLGLRAATRLPNAKHPSGLGQDTTDFYSSLILSGAVSATRITGAVGLGILGDPLRGNRHVHSALYGATLSHDVSSHAAVVAGIDGRTGPPEPGLESRAIARAGIAWTRSPLRVDADGTLGLTTRDGGVGFALNATLTFHAFTPN